MMEVLFTIGQKAIILNDGMVYKKTIMKDDNELAIALEKYRTRCADEYMPDGKLNRYGVIERYVPVYEKKAYAFMCNAQFPMEFEQFVDEISIRSQSTTRISSGNYDIQLPYSGEMRDKLARVSVRIPWKVADAEGKREYLKEMKEYFKVIKPMVDVEIKSAMNRLYGAAFGKYHCGRIMIMSDHTIEYEFVRKG